MNITFTVPKKKKKKGKGNDATLCANSLKEH